MNIDSFYINLDDRTDRNEQAIVEFEGVGLSPTRFAGHKRNNPIEGCIESHKAILNKMRGMDKHVLIFEDDVRFVNDVKELLPLAFQELEQRSWCMFYLGGNICGPIQQVSPHLGRLSHCQSTHAYMVNKNFIDTLLLEIAGYTNHLDLFYTDRVVPRYPCFITVPMLAIQRPSYSDIEKKHVNYEWMFDRYNRNLKRL
jgi:hypothetical protein